MKVGVEIKTLMEGSVAEFSSPNVWDSFSVKRKQWVPHNKLSVATFQATALHRSSFAGYFSVSHWLENRGG